MKLLSRSPTLLAALWLCLAPGAMAQGAREVPQSPAVERVELLVEGGARPNWSVQGDWIAFDRAGGDGFYDIHLLSSDGSFERCVTCQLLELKKAHAFGAVWHPSGKFLVFQVQLRAKRIGQGAAELTTPDRGLHTELWAITRDGKLFWRLGANTVAPVINPRFSHEGGLLAWSERVASRRGRWGDWVLRIAEVKIGSGLLRLGKIRTLDPGGRSGDKARGSSGGRLRQLSEFDPSDKAILIAANLEPGQPDVGMDLYLVSTEGGEKAPVLRRLTETLGEWDEAGRFSPDGQRLVWSSTQGVPRIPLRQPEAPPTARASRRDLWMMKADGTDQVRLTYFNHPAAGLRNGAVVGDAQWSPDGGRLLVHVVTDTVSAEEGLYLVELAEDGGEILEPPVETPVVPPGGGSSGG